MASAPKSSDKSGGGTGGSKRTPAASALSDYLFQRIGSYRFNLLYLAPAVTILWLVVLQAWQQPLHPDPYAPRPLFSSAWWAHPIELNAHKRWPIVGGAINDLVLRPSDGSGELWAAGEGGLLLVSRDGGGTWEQKEIQPGAPVYLPDGQPVVPVDLDLQVQQGQVQQEQEQVQEQAQQEEEPAQQEEEPPMSPEDQVVEAERELADLAGQITSLQGQLEKMLLSMNVDPGDRASFIAEAAKSPDEIGKKFGLSRSEVEFLVSLDTDLQGLLRRQETVRSALELAQEALGAARTVGDGSGAPAARPTLDPAKHVTRTLHAIDFAGDVGLAVGEHGVIVRSEDGGQTWALQTVGAGNHDLYDVALLPDEGRGWAVGEQGLWSTQDNGLSWQLLAVAGLERPLRVIRFLASDVFAAAGDDGTVVLTPDSGQTWQSNSPGEPGGLISDLLDIRAGEPLTGASLVPGISSSLVRLEVGDEQGFVGLYLIGPPLEAAWQPLDGDAAWIVGEVGRAWQVTDQAQVVEHQAVTDANLTAVVFTEDASRGWVGTAEGRILHTADGGATWTHQAMSAAGFLAAMARRDGITDLDKSLWRIGEGGVLERRSASDSEDWGPDLGQRRHYPPPWFYLAIGLAGFLFLRGVARVPSRAEAGGRDIADQGLSDRPLEPGDPDPLGFSVIAEAISGFLRNENTEPPLTIAVTGDWGTGKSSILNLVRHDLRQVGFRPIWFNAWHHQSEESLLAALLESIRQQAIPPLWHPSGLPYRLNLLRIRFRRRPALLATLWVLLAFSLGYLLVAPVEDLGSALDQALSTSSEVAGSEVAGSEVAGSEVADSEGGDGEGEGESEGLLTPLLKFAGAILQDGKAYLGLIGSLIGLILNAQNKFGLSGRGMRRLLGGAPARVEDLKSHLGFRHRFAQEFRDVTEALKPLTMVIIIDDLDRCRATSIIDTLQLTNFLVSSGDCYILLGIAPEQLLEIIDEDLGAGIDARSYLEKLINIEIPVPTLAEGEGFEVLAAERTDTPASAARRQWLSFAKAAAFTAAFLGIVLVGYWIAGEIHGGPKDATAPAAPVTQKADAGAEDGAGEGTVEGTNGMPQTAATQETASETAEVAAEEAAVPKTWAIPAEVRPRETWPAYLVAILVAGLGGLLMWDRLRRKRLAVVRDSPQFSTALRIWFAVISARHGTPRALKRYLNRLRYLAMRQRVSRASQDVDWTEDISESSLVALSALEGVAPDRLESVVNGMTGATEKAIQEAYKKHMEMFDGWELVQEDLPRYKALRYGITSR